MKLVLYTLEQVQTEIDNLDDPRLTVELSVQVDDEDREAILKKVNSFVVYIYFTLIKQIIKKQKITRGAHKGEEKEMIVEEFGM